jgi:hypothetical protein
MDPKVKMINDLHQLNAKVAVVIMVIPIIIAFLNYKKLNKALKIVNIYCFSLLSILLLLQLIILVVDSFKDFFVPILITLKIRDMSFISILDYLNKFITLGLFYSIVISRGQFAKLIKNLSLFLVISSLINYFFIEGYNVQSVYNSTTSSIFCFLLPLIHLWYLYNDIETKVPLIKNPYFWISLGIMLPNLVGLFMNLAGKKMEETDTILFLQANIVHDIIQMIGYILIAYGFHNAKYTKYMPKTTA